MHARRMNSASSERPVTTAERKGLRYALIRARSTAWLVMAAVLLSGCTHTSAYIHNGFKVGPNYEMPPAAVALAMDRPQRAAHRYGSDRSQCMVDTLPRSCSGRIDRRRPSAEPGPEDRALRMCWKRRRSGTSRLATFCRNHRRPSGAYAHLQLPRSLGLPFTGLSNVWLPGFNASWELDFWGRYRRAVEARTATLEANVADFNNALVTLFADVATSYVNLRLAQRRLELLRRNVEIQKDVLQISEARFQKGVTTELDVEQGRLNVAQTESSMPPLRVSLRQQNNQLCLLLGIPPQELSSRTGRFRRRPRRSRWAFPPTCCAAGPTSARPKGRWRREAPRSASPNRPVSALLAVRLHRIRGRSFFQDFLPTASWE